MMLKTSSRKLNPFGKMIGFTLRKNTGIIVIICILALLYCPGSYIVNYEDYMVGANNSVRDFLLENFALLVSVMSAIIAIGFNVLNLSFLYKKNSSDVFHSFPLTRTELLLSRTLSSIISTFIPVAVCYASYGIMMAFNSWMGSFAQLFYYLLHTVIITLVCSSFSLIFIVSAGSAFDLGVSLIGSNIALMIIGVIFDSILTETLVGYDSYLASDIMYNLSPPYFCGVGLGYADSVVKYGISGSSIEFLIRSVIYIAIFTVASVLLFNHRKAEKGGTAYAYKFMYLGCSLLAGICGGYMFGMMFAGSLSNIAFWVFMVIGATLTAVIYGVVTNRGFKGFGRSVIMGVAAVLIIIAVAVTGITGGFGYSNRVPEKQDIKEVYVSAFGEQIPFANPEDAIDLHNAILDTDATDIGNESYRYVENVRFNYYLKNGKVVSREFNVLSNKVKNELFDIYKSEERLKMIKEHLYLDTSTQISLYFMHDDKNYYTVSLTKAEAKEFLDLYWQDVLNCGDEIFDGYAYGHYEISGNNTSYEDKYFHFSLENFESFTNSKQFIVDHNLVERAEAEEKY